MFDFHCVNQKNIKKSLKNCISYSVYSQIWLNLPKDDRHFSYKQIEVEDFECTNATLVVQTRWKWIANELGLVVAS
jgi:hypothetical protein